MPTFAETVRDHYQAGIKDETELLTRLNRIIDEIEPPLTAEKFAAFDQFHVGGLAATVELGKRAEITRDSGIVKQLIAAPVSEWEAIFATSAQGDYAHAPSDANYPLLKSALSAAAAQNPIDFVIASGDYLQHDFRRAFIKAGGSPSDFPTFSDIVLARIAASIGILKSR
jgi:hypothetical protein